MDRVLIRATRCCGAEVTTIATDGLTMAGDGLQTVGGTICSTTAVKVFRLKDGSLFGACGGSGWGEKLMRWLDGGQEGDPPKGEKGDGFLWLRSNGELCQGDEDGLATPISAPFAIGSGFDNAIGAMDAGASPEEAVAIAARRNPHTGGRITSLMLSIADRRVRAV